MQQLNEHGALLLRVREQRNGGEALLRRGCETVSFWPNSIDPSC